MAGKLITGFLQDVGIRIKYSIVDPGVLSAAQYNYEGETHAPDHDLYVWYWTMDIDPNFQTSLYTPQQIEGWNDCLWTDPEYTQLWERQSEEMDTQKRKEIVDRMQEIFYKGSAYAVLAYSHVLEAHSTAKWEGWTKSPAEIGPAVVFFSVIDTYLNLKPKTVAAEDEGLTAGLIAGIVIAMAVVIAVAALVVIMMRRRRSRSEVQASVEKAGPQR